MARYDGTAGADKYTGGADNDIAYGYAGDDLLHGGAGIDTLDGGGDNDTLYGDAGADYLFGQDGNDKLYGGEDNDFLSGGLGDDRLDGGNGDDRIETGGGNDTVLGGNGADTIYVQGNAGETVTVDAGADDDFVSLTTNGLVVVKGGTGTDTLYIHQAVLHDFSKANGFEKFDGDGFVSGTATADRLDFSGLQSTDATRVYGWHIDGGAGDDVITGTGYRDYITGGDDNDTLNGGGGDDTLMGEGGHNEMHGGDGNDTLTADGGSLGDTMFGDAGQDALNGGNGDDVIHGGNDADTIWGAYGDKNALFGDDGNDTITSSGAHDTVSGGNGDDRLILNAHLEMASVSGGTGTDTLVLQGDIAFHDTAAQITGVEKIEFGYAAGVRGTDDADTIDFGKFELVTGSLYASAGAGNDRVIGTSGNDTIYGEAGNDTIEGGLGNDHIIGGRESDFSPGLDYASYEHATGGVTVSLAIDVSQDTGAAGWDQIEQVEGLIGSAFGDTLTGSDNADWLLGGKGLDTLSGGAGNDTIDGGDDADTLNGGIGSDTITGGLGNDVIDGGGLRNQDPADPQAPPAAPDVLKGGAGADVYVWSNALDLGLYYGPDGHGHSVMKGGGLAAQVEFNASEGDTLSILAGQGLTFKGDGALVADTHGSIAYTQNDAGTLVLVDVNGDGAVDSSIQLDHHVDLVETAPGSGVLVGFDQILGTNDIDHLTGRAGNESLRGLDGADWLEGALGNDRLDGGAGPDTASYLHAGGAVHVSLELAGPQDTGSAGSDTLVSIENLTGSAYGDTLTGNAGGNVIQGRDGNDVIEGHGGYDQLDGGAGADTYLFGSWSDWNLGDGKDGSLGGQLRLDAQDHIALDGLGDFTFLGHEDFTASGTFEVRYEVVGNSTLIQADADGDGHADHNYRVLDGTAIERSGNSLVKADGPAVFTIGTNAADTIVGTRWNDQISGLEGNDRLSGGAGDDQLFGQGGSDRLAGQAGNDILIGGDQADFLDGGIGSDTLMGGAGNDTFQFSAFAAGDSDKILDFQSGDVIDLHLIDANPNTVMDDGFRYLGSDAFSGHPGELRVDQGAVGQASYVSGDIDGDGHADFTFQVMSDHPLVQGDFLL